MAKRAKAPLRISFVGGATDFPYYYNKYGALIISTTIDQYVYASKGNSDLDPDIDRIAKECNKMVNGRWEINLDVTSDIPNGRTGLGSSSATTIAILRSLGVKDSERLAKLAIAIERRITGLHPGAQDQWAIAHGGFNAIRFQENQVSVQRLPKSYISMFNEHLMLARLKDSQEDITKSMRDRQGPNTGTLDAMKRIAQDMYFDIHGGKLTPAMLGNYLTESWLLKAKLAPGITNNDIDFNLASALEMGAYGGKVCGSGGGGSLLLCVPDDNTKSKICSSLKLEEMTFKCSTT